MSPNRLRRVEELYHAARERQPQDRRSFLVAACEGDATLQQEVESLLGQPPDSLLDGPAWEQLPSLLAGQGIAPETQFGPYRVLSLLGSGGMGEVYRARDTRLGRDVALKVLPADVAGDASRRRRFETEARAVAALKHPNIVAVFDVGAEDGVSYIVSELVDGKPLRGAKFGLSKTVDIAVQIAAGLAAAHDAGIVHRDLKPENILVTRDGLVKILDFGLAKVRAEQIEGTGASETLTVQTEPGMVMGTAGYMSPEQVRGGTADPRSDIFSFGAILYEMLTGRRAFQGASSVETMNAILKEEPPEISKTGRKVPPALEQIVMHCLERNPDKRFQGAADLAFALGSLSGLSDSGVRTAAAPRKLPKRRGLILAAALVALAATGVLTVRWFTRASPAEAPKLTNLTYSGHDMGPASSPDGRTIAFASDRDGRYRIWLKDIGKGGEVALTSGGDGDFNPRFSPDGSMILFQRAEGDRSSLYRIAIVGGEPRKLVDGTGDGDWSPDGRQIAFVGERTVNGESISSIWVAGADGENLREIAHVVNQGFGLVRWSPDGSRIAAGQYPRSSGLSAAIFVARADGSNSRAIPTSSRGTSMSSVAWSADDEVIYAQAESIVGASRLVRQNLHSGAAQTILWIPQHCSVIDIVGPGRVVFDSSVGTGSLREISLVGKSAPPVRWLTRGDGYDSEPTYSPDGESILFTSNRSGNLDLWTISTKTGSLRRITDHPADDWDPSFTADGKQIVWSSNRSGRYQVWIANADGSDARRLTNDEVGAENPTSTPDGAWILFHSTDPAKAGIWKIRPDGSEATRLVADAAVIPQVSPDGRYVSYIADGSVRVVRFADGAPAPFEIRSASWSRWMSGGRAIAFNGHDKNGVGGIYAQDFVPGQDTSRTRRPLGGSDPFWAGRNPDVGAFDISPDNAHMTVEYGDDRYNLTLAENVSGVSPPKRVR